MPRPQAKSERLTEKPAYLLVAHFVLLMLEIINLVVA